VRAAACRDAVSHWVSQKEDPRQIGEGRLLCVLYAAADLHRSVIGKANKDDGDDKLARHLRHPIIAEKWCQPL
jgi:hypothetical protein